MPRPTQKVILYRAGTHSAEHKTRKRGQYGDAYTFKHKQGFITCPECGRPANTKTGMPHRLPRPNNFMWCDFVV